MKVGKAQGMAIGVFGLLLLIGGILVLVYVPSWGNWMADYPGQAAKTPFPAEVAPIAKGVGAVLGPVLVQVGGYLKAAGYFIGSLLTIVSLGVLCVATMVIRAGKTND